MAKKTEKTAEKAVEKPVKKVTLKRALRAKKLARKNASKTVVYDNRDTRRSAKQSKEKKTQKQQREVVRAPYSARITPAKGPLQSLASRTKAFGPHNSKRSWYLVDASDLTVGRLATELAKLLRGKHKATFTPNMDTGDFVVVVNAEKVKFTSLNKEETKKYYDYSGYVGGLKARTARTVRETYPERILWRAVDGMVPAGPLGRRQMKKLKIYKGTEHPHKAQGPVVWKIQN